MSSELELAVQWNQSSPSWSLCNSTEESSGGQEGDSDSSSPVGQFQPPYYSITVGQDKTLQWDPPADSEELAIALSYHFPLPKTLEAKMQAATQKWLHARRKTRAANESARVAQNWAVAETQVAEPQFQHVAASPAGFISHKASMASLQSFNVQDGMRDSLNLQLSPKDHSSPWGIVMKDDAEGCSPTMGGSDIPGMISWRIDTGEMMPPASRKRPYEDEERIRVAKNRGKVCDYHRRRKQKCDPDVCNQNKQRIKAGDEVKEIPSVTKPVQDAVPSKQPNVFVQNQDWPLWNHSDTFDLAGMTTDDIQQQMRFPAFMPETSETYHLKGSIQEVPGIQQTQANQYTFCNEWSSLWQTSVSDPSPPSSYEAKSGINSDVKERPSFSDSSDTSNAPKPIDHQSEIKGLLEMRSQRMENSNLLAQPANNGTENMSQAYDHKFQYSGQPDSIDPKEVSEDGPTVYPTDCFDLELGQFINGGQLEDLDFGVDVPSMSNVRVLLRSGEPIHTDLIDRVHQEHGPARKISNEQSVGPFDTRFTSEEWPLAATSTQHVHSIPTKDQNGEVQARSVINQAYKGNEKSYPSCETSYGQAPNFATVPNAYMPSSHFMRRASVISSGSQTSRYGRLRSSRASAAGMREWESGAISRRDSTNSMASHESAPHQQFNMLDRPLSRRGMPLMPTPAELLSSKPRRSSLWEGSSISSEMKQRGKPLEAMLGFSFKRVEPRRLADTTPPIDDLISAMNLTHV